MAVRREKIDVWLDSWFFGDVERIDCETVCLEAAEEIEDETGASLSGDERRYCQLTCKSTVEAMERFTSILRELRQANWNV